MASPFQGHYHSLPFSLAVPTCSFSLPRPTLILCVLRAHVCGEGPRLAAPPASSFCGSFRKIERSASELDIHEPTHASGRQGVARQHPRVHFHFIPTSSSGSISSSVQRTHDRQLKRLAVTMDQLIEAINHYIDRRNDNPTPFVWTASAQSIIAKVSKAKETLATQHSEEPRR